MTTTRGQKATGDGASHRFAWDGFSFDVPVEWNLSAYAFGPRVSNVQLEDGTGSRLEFEWTRAAKPIAPDLPAKRYARASDAMTAKALDRDTVAGLPCGWQGCSCEMPEGLHLVTALCRSGDGLFFGLLRLHFRDSGRRKPVRILRELAGSFSLHGAGRLPWRFYDVSFDLGRDFGVVSSRFRAGQKLMVFERRLRRLYLWHFSLADLLLKDKTPTEWAADFLNRGRDIRGPRFAPGEGSSINAGRAWRYPIGRLDEIARLCLRYRAACAPVPGRNAILLAVYNYRVRDDLRGLAQALACPAPSLVEGLTGP